MGSIKRLPAGSSGNGYRHSLDVDVYKRQLYKKNEVVKTIRTDIEGIASTSSDLLPYGKFLSLIHIYPNPVYK